MGKILDNVSSQCISSLLFQHGIYQVGGKKITSILFVFTQTNTETHTVLQLRLIWIWYTDDTMMQIAEMVPLQITGRTFHH